MMKTSNLALGIVSTIALGLIIYAFRLNRKYKFEKRLYTISDAGYETAYDVLYPIKYKRFKRR